MVEHVKHCGYRQSIPMIASKKFFILCLLFICQTQAFAQPNFVYEYCENDKGNYTPNSTYRENLNLILSILPSGEGNGHGFYSWSSSFYGQSDEVHVVGLCRGDVEPDICRSCLNQSTHLLTQVCPDQKQAIGGFDECILRYSNRSSFGVMLTHPRFNLWSTLNVSSDYVDAFSQQLRTLLNSLKDQASFGGSQMKFATGNTTILGFRTIYAFLQCTPDLSQPECNNCLEEAFGDIPKNKTWIGGRVVTPSCNFRYEVHTFNGTSYDMLPTSRLQSTVVLRSSQSSRNTGNPQGKKSNKSRNMIIIISTTVPSVALLGLIVSIGVYTRVKKCSSDKKTVVESQDLLPPEVLEEIGCAKCFHFDFSTIRNATNNFDERNKISAGQFDDIYRGTLHDGQMIAVKICKGNNLDSRDVFKNEVQYGTKVRHRNLVRLLGFCLKQNNRFLIYEFLPLKLDLLLFDTTSQRAHLDWNERYKIITGIARGLLYLHEDYPSTVIHRDIKPRNILLDEDINPKISGLELARLCGVHQSEVTTHVIGTLGYMDPEYISSGRISVKSDVYSFGVLLLEIISGQKTTTFSLEHREPYTNYACRNWIQGTASDLIDPKIRDDISVFDHEIVMRCIQIGLLCVQPESQTRPTMNSVVHMLCCDSILLPTPSNPMPRSNGSVFVGDSDDDIHSETVTIPLSEASLDDQVSTIEASPAG